MRGVAFERPNRCAAPITIRTTCGCSTGVDARSRRSRPMTDPIRRKILKTGAAATVMAATPRVFADESGQRGAAMSFYERGPVRIHYEVTGSGFPLLLIAGGGLNSTIAALNNPF